MARGKTPRRKRKIYSGVKIAAEFLADSGQAIVTLLGQGDDGSDVTYRLIDWNVATMSFVVMPLDGNTLPKLRADQGEAE